MEIQVPELSVGRCTVRPAAAGSSSKRKIIELLVTPNGRNGEPRARGAEAAMPDDAETVLLVDDEDAVRAVLARVLRAAGYRVLEAMNGHRAIDVAGQYAAHIDVIVTDLRMPGMDGRRLLEKFRGWYPGVRFLLISGQASPASAMAGLDDTRTAFLAKPFTGAELVAAVRDLLE